MTIEDQVRLVNGHSDIFSSLGSAAHNILFALGTPRLHLLASRDDIPANYFLCSALVGAPTTFVNCLGSGGRTSPNDERLNRRAESFENPEKKRPVDAEPGPQSMPQLVEMDAGGRLPRPSKVSSSTRTRSVRAPSSPSTYSVGLTKPGFTLDCAKPRETRISPSRARA